MNDHNKLVSDSNDLWEIIASMVRYVKMNHNKNKCVAIDIQEQIKLGEPISNDSQAMGALNFYLSIWDQQFNQFNKKFFI